MKNTFAKNLVKSMSAYGEMLNVIGCYWYAYRNPFQIEI